MIKTTYQTPELRDSNDNIIQQGAFGKNTALSNSTNDGWIDYVMNNLEALHDVVGETSPTLDANGHVVEPANLAIGDEDGNRIKNSYLKLTGGKVTGTLNVQQRLRILDNQENVFGGFYVPASSATNQFLQIYGGESVNAGNANIVLRPSGDGRFQINAYNSDGSSLYQLGSNNSGQLFWRGNELAWRKDYLALTGGTMSGWLQFSNQANRICVLRSSTNHDGDMAIYGGYGYANGAYLYLNGTGRASQPGYFGIRAVTDGSNYKELQGRPDGTLAWGGRPIFRGYSNINNGNGLGCEKNEANNTVKQWNRLGVNAGASATWTFTAPMANNYYYASVCGENGNNVSITSRSETAITVQNNGSTWCGVSMLIIGTPASQ